MDFYSRVKGLVKERTSLTLRDFIISMGMNYETYYSGKRIGYLPRVDDALRIAESLHTSVEYLVNGVESSKEDTFALIKAKAKELNTLLENI